MATTALALSLAAISLATTSPAWAEDAQHPEQAATAPAPAATPEQTVQRMRDNTAMMQSQLDALAAAKTPEEHQKLHMQHMQTMRENMMLGQQMAAGDGAPMGCAIMGGKGMMGGMMSGMMGGMGMMGADPSGASPEAMAQRMHQMERRMDMMQMMMERMAAPAGKRPAR
ncbi:Uncharacterized protein ToN1_42380 [Aromatoleum petrolei]|nr:Uncharacterized protein ToN1_42380 [Aromatoleum petrolei]